MRKLLIILICILNYNWIYSQGINLPVAKPKPKSNTTSSQPVPAKSEKQISISLIWEGDKTVIIFIGSSRFVCQSNSQQTVSIPYKTFYPITVETPVQKNSAENFFQPEPENGGTLTISWPNSYRYPIFKYESLSELREAEARVIREIQENQKQAQIAIITKAKVYLSQGNCDEANSYFNENYPENGPLKMNSTEVMNFIDAVEDCRTQKIALETERKKQNQLYFINQCASEINLNDCISALKKFENNLPAGPLTKQSPEALDFLKKVKICQEEQKKLETEKLLSIQKDWLKNNILTLIESKKCDSAEKLIIKKLPKGPLTSTSTEIIDIQNKINDCKNTIAAEEALRKKQKQAVMIINCESLLTENRCEEAEKLYAEIATMGPLTEKSAELLALKNAVTNCRLLVKQKAVENQKQLLLFANEAIQLGQCDQAEDFYSRAKDGPLKESESVFIEVLGKIKKCQIDVKFNELFYQYSNALSQYKYESALNFIIEAKKLKPTDKETLENFSELNLKLTEGIVLLNSANKLFIERKFTESAEQYQKLQEILPFWDKIPKDRIGEIVKKEQFQRLIISYNSPNKNYHNLRKLTDSCLATDPNNSELMRISKDINFQILWNEHKDYVNKGEWKIAKSRILAANEINQTDSGNVALQYINKKIKESDFQRIKETSTLDSLVIFLRKNPDYYDSSNFELNKKLAEFYMRKIELNYGKRKFRKSIKKNKPNNEKALMFQYADYTIPEDPKFKESLNARLWNLKLERRYNDGLEILAGMGGTYMQGNLHVNLSDISTLNYPNPAKTVVNWQNINNYPSEECSIVSGKLHFTNWKFKKPKRAIGRYFDIHGNYFNANVYFNSYNQEITFMNDRFSELYIKENPNYYKSIGVSLFSYNWVFNNVTQSSDRVEYRMSYNHLNLGTNLGWRFGKSRQKLFFGLEAHTNYILTHGAYIRQYGTSNLNLYPVDFSTARKNTYLSPSLTYGIGPITTSIQPLNSKLLPIITNPDYSTNGYKFDADLKLNLTRWWKIGINYSIVDIRQSYLLPVFSTQETQYLINKSDIDVQKLKMTNYLIYTAIMF